MLVKKGILSDRKGKVYEIFTNYITPDFLKDMSLPLTMKPSDYVVECWTRYKNNASPSTYKTTNSMNGNIFEVIVATALYRCKVLPFYCQATAFAVPDVNYDILMYDKINEVPITVSMKTSTRERYKQADLEAYALKNVHRSAINYLVMLNQKECRKIQAKISKGITMGLDNAICANTDDFDKLISDLKSRTLGAAPTIKLFDGSKIK